MSLVRVYTRNGMFSWKRMVYINFHILNTNSEWTVHNKLPKYHQTVDVFTELSSIRDTNVKPHNNTLALSQRLARSSQGFEAETLARENRVWATGPRSEASGEFFRDSGVPATASKYQITEDLHGAKGRDSARHQRLHYNRDTKTPKKWTLFKSQDCLERYLYSMDGLYIQFFLQTIV